MRCAKALSNVKRNHAPTLGQGLLLFLTALLLILPPCAFSAGNQTTTGSATASIANQGLLIEAPYTDDDNTNNSLLIEWDEDGGNWSSLLGSQTLPNAVSPYSHTIGPLINGSSYQVRVTYQDDDGVSGTATQTITGLTPYNPLIHNSLSTGSNTWTADGGWGIANSKYGEFSCTTCHVRGSTNIKQIRTSITTPDASKGLLPGDGNSISLLSTQNGTSDFGDDSIVRSSSNKICEICHSQNRFHNYDRANNSANDHQNKTDCMLCHQHGSGFVASCSACHGGGSRGSAGSNYWPDASTANSENDTPGRHLKHIDALSQLKWGYDSATLLNRADHHNKQIDLCGYCHSDPGGASHNDASTDTAFSNAWDKAIDADASITAGNCSNINCHNNQATGTGTYGWLDAGTSACIMCHNDVTNVGNTTGKSHRAHTDAAATYGVVITCATCHDGATSWATSTAPAANHWNGALNVTGTVTLTYTGSLPAGSSFGTCGTNACHNIGDGTTAPWSNLTWGTAVDSCNICHRTAPDYHMPFTHDEHMREAHGPRLAVNAADRGCDHCHTNTGDTAEHINGTPNVIAGSCDTCHGSDGVSTSGPDQIPDWNNASTVTCATCHTGTHIADITAGVTTPVKLDSTHTTCTTWCHGSVGDNNHLGPLGDTDRVTRAGHVPGSYAFCTACHVKNTHFADSHTADGNSTDAEDCIDCHDVHGQNDKNAVRLDAFLRSDVGGQTVSGFTDKTLASSYYNAENEGICQACHDAAEVSHYNRAGSDGHQSGTRCTTCHTHWPNDPAFSDECYSCHGDGAAEYWPQNAGNDRTQDAFSDFNNAGRHQEHMEALATKLAITLPGSDAEQRQMCAYCHDLTDSDHAGLNNGFADVFPSGAQKYWDATNDADATWNTTNYNSCSNIDCHNSKETANGTYGWYDAGTTACIMCHDNVTTTGTHLAHLDATATYGLTITCDDCHYQTGAAATIDFADPTKKPGTGHWDGNWTTQVDVSGVPTDSYTGDSWATRTKGTCGTNDCHNDGTGGTPKDNVYTWETAEASACGICHDATVATYDHTIHLSWARGPKLGTNCGACHDANANNTSMNLKTTHINGKVTFTDGGVAYELANGDIDNGTNTVDTCDTCHGGAADANTAKGYWFTATRVSCESCHVTAGTLSVIDGDTAPAKDLYATLGHGKKVGGWACTNCHNRNDTGHFDGITGDDLRLNAFADFSTDPTGWCKTCHAQNAHFVDSHTADGTSTSGDKCTICHEPHGEGMGTNTDAMLIVGENFTNGLNPSSYFNGSNNGVCQTCHDPLEVSHYNTAGSDGHNSGTQCTSCHVHRPSNPAFQGGECYDCHGDTVSEYWPQSVGTNDRTQDAFSDFNDDGRHTKHMQVLADKLGFVLPGTDAQQRAACAYCHDLTDTDHAGLNNGFADVFPSGAQKYWDATNDADATWNTTNYNSCSNIDCHNSKETADGTYGWYDAGISNCAMCHAKNGTYNLPAGASHYAHLTEIGPVYYSSGKIGCPDCHSTTVATSWSANIPPTNGHIDGTFSISGSRGLDYTGTYPATKGSCGINSCHNDGKGGTPTVATYNWDTAGAINSCTGCHQNNADGHAPHTAAAGTIYSGTNCTTCHSTSSTSANHLDGNVAMAASMNYSGTLVVGDAAFGTCNTTSCHQDGTGAQKLTPQWDRTPVSGDECGLCHSATPNSGSHADHLSATNGPGLGTDCGACHQANSNNSSMAGKHSTHINGSVTFVNRAAPASPFAVSSGTIGAASSDAVDSCNNCHGGATPALIAKDNWGASTSVSCESCHGDYSAATSAADGTGVSAPVRSFNYDTAGHGQGGIAKACADCHTTTSSHISGTPGDANRIKDISNLNFDTGGEENAWCNVCHASTMPVHYANSKTAGGNSSDGLYCITCHDPHGSSSYDAMVRSNLHGRNVASFTDRSVRSQYYNDNDPLDNSGVCQVCHELENADQVKYYNRTDTPVAHYPGNCISCHSHAGTEAFKPSGCSGCHGGGTTGNDGLNKNYWPDSADQTVDNAGSGDDSGLHLVHLTVLAKRVYNETIGAEADNSILLDNTSNNGGVTSDTKQTALCAYCHTNPGSHNDHNNGDDAALMTIKHLNGAADDGAVDAFTPAASVTCSSVDCHNGKTTTTWYAANSGSVSCTLCHTAGGSNSALLANPNSGLHTGSVPTISGQKHDASVTGGCAACHDALSDYGSYGSSHINGTVSTNGSLAGDRTAMGLFGSYQNSGSDNTGTCATTCHSGAGDNGSWARLWDSSVHYDPADGDFVECAGCHGGFAGDWTFGSADSTVDGSVSHDRNWDEDGTPAEVIGNHPDNTDKCKSCHGFGYAGVYDEANFSAHRDGKITFADEMGYNPSTHTCATYCHSSNSKHNLESSGWLTTGNTVDTPPLACTDCHAGAQASAGVNADSPHSTNTIFASKGVTYSCQDCHGGHNLGDTQVPNNATVGISYGTGGIDLSDPVGTATTEAEICWGCHDLHSVSEWDVNTDTNTASFPNFNFGSLSTSNWVGSWNGSSGTTAVWSSADFLYKQGNIQSTHSASASGVSGKDIVDNIRCSYCHDVHNTNLTAGDSYSDQPFLRGSWVGNPYLEDGAPRNDGTTDDANYSAYNVAGKFGAVPRGGTSYTAKGGYYIDQNSGYPTNNAAMDSPDKFAGLCRLCHEGTAGIPGDGIWQPEEIDNLNKFGDPSADWVGTNGHGAAIKGGGGSQAANIFTNADRMPSWQAYSGQLGTDGGNPVMAYLNSRFVDRGAFADAYGYGVRGVDSRAYQYTPYVDTGSRGYNYRVYNWGATVVVESGSTMSDSGIDVGYHQFTCSKCHNPHASRLPRLMITNCLDTNHNTWDDTLVTPASDTNGGSAALSPVNRNAEFSQMTSAQNCHRYSDPNDADAMGSGWNTVTPWKEF